MLVKQIFSHDRLSDLDDICLLCMPDLRLFVKLHFLNAFVNVFNTMLKILSKCEKVIIYVYYIKIK